MKTRRNTRSLAKPGQVVLMVLELILVFLGVFLVVPPRSTDPSSTDPYSPPRGSVGDPPERRTPERRTQD